MTSPILCFPFRVPQNPTSPQVWLSLIPPGLHANVHNALMSVSLLVFFLLQIPKRGRRSWSRWRPSPSLAMSCPWPACSWSEPVETLCCSVSKMPRYDRLSCGIKTPTTQNSFQPSSDCIYPPTSFLSWSTIQGRTT